MCIRDSSRPFHNVDILVYILGPSKGSIYVFMTYSIVHLCILRRWQIYYHFVLIIVLVYLCLWQRISDIWSYCILHNVSVFLYRVYDILLSIGILSSVLYFCWYHITIYSFVIPHLHIFHIISVFLIQNIWYIILCFHYLPCILILYTSHIQREITRGSIRAYYL